MEAKGRQGETEATSIRYVVETPGVGTDSERAIRGLIMLMVLRRGPLAIALTACCFGTEWNRNALGPG